MTSNSVENHGTDGLMIDGSDLDVVTELAKCSCETSGAMLLEFGIALRTLFDESNAFMQDLPNYAPEAMSDGPNGGLIV
jgi:hypothetical protein